MIKKYKLILVANTFVFFKVFLLNHIKYLSKKYDIFIICNNSIELKELIPRNVSLININFKRGFNFIHDVLSFFMILYFFLILRPSSSISFTPKIGFMVAIASFIARTSFRIHWYTGQIWANKSGFKKLFYKLIDRLIFFFSHKVLVDGFSQRKFLINENVICKSNSFVLHKGSVGGVDISRFKLDKEKRIELRKKYSISNNTFVFLYLGRINKEKGIVELIKAFKKIKKINNVLLIIVGPLEDTELLSLLKKKKFYTLHTQINLKNGSHLQISCAFQVIERDLEQW